jgi:hypothetical protein
LLTTNPTWTDLDMNPGLHAGRPATNSRAMTQPIHYLKFEDMITQACFKSCLHDYVVLDRHTHNTFTGTTILL